MKKFLLTAILMGGLLSAQAQAPLLYEDFDATTVGSLPSGWTSSGGFKVYGSPHGWSAPNACSVQMSSTNTQDTLTMPSIGPLTANTKLSITYRFVNTALYPSTGTQLQAGDQVTIDAYIAGNWNNSVATIDMNTNPTPLTTWTTYTYTNSLFALVAGQNVQLRLDAARANGDWFLDIDNIIIGDAVSGISVNALNPPAIAVSPNPCSGNFWVWVKDYQGNPAVTVKMYNNMGQLVKTITTTETQFVNQYSIDVKDLARGMYTVEVNVKNEVSKSKLILE